MTRFHALAAVVLASSLACAVAAQDDKLSDKPPADKNPQATESGIQYSVLREGKPGGVKPKPGDICRVHYTGYHAPGGIFDSSVQRKEPFNFEIGKGVIKGWSEGVQLMTPGARFKFTIPPALAYGEQGAAPKIAPSETLVFVIELIEAFTPTIDKSKQKEHPRGYKYEVLAEGTGEAPTGEQLYKFHWAQWSADGKTCQGSSMTDPRQRGRPNLAKRGAIQPEFLDEILLTMKQGAKLRLDVPGPVWKRADAPKDAPTPKPAILILEMVEVIAPLKAPAFAIPPAEKLTTTASGLKYAIRNKGNDKKPKLGDLVRIHYIGWLENGTKFDASYDRAEPGEFRLGGVFPGWNEGLQLLGEGGEIVLVLPPKLGYGAQDMGVVPPNSTLVFHLKLLSVK